MTARRRWRLAAVLAVLAHLPGCGYALVGRGITTDASIKRIGVPVFRDTTGKPNLDQIITRKVIEELLRKGRFDVVQQATGVDAVVDGEKTATNEPMWANDSFTFRDEYDVGSDASSFIDLEGPAMERLSVAFARSLVSAMLEAF
jgi:hypothetical protein